MDNIDLVVNFEKLSSDFSNDKNLVGFLISRSKNLDKVEFSFVDEKVIKMKFKTHGHYFANMQFIGRDIRIRM